MIKAILIKDKEYSVCLIEIMLNNVIIRNKKYLKGSKVWRIKI